MKTIKLLVFGIMLMLASSAQSQLTVNVHIGTPPAWGPSGYTDVRYYYLPDVEAYYDVQNSMFIYMAGNVWIRRNYLPSRYRNYDLYHGYKVVMTDYRGNSPYYHFKDHKVKYRKGYRGPEQHNIGVRSKKVVIHEVSRRKVESHDKKKSKGHDNGHDNSKRK